MKQSDISKQKYLIYSAGEKKFASQLKSIREVVQDLVSCPVPNSPPYCLGMSSLRGDIFTVNDLGVKMGNEPTKNSSKVYLILSSEMSQIAIAIDKINKVLPFTEDDIKKLPRKGDEDTNKIYIEGYLDIENEVIPVIKLDSLFGMPNDIKNASNY